MKLSHGCSTSYCRPTKSIRFCTLQILISSLCCFTMPLSCRSLHISPFPWSSIHSRQTGYNWMFGFAHIKKLWPSHKYKVHTLRTFLVNILLCYHSLLGCIASSCWHYCSPWSLSKLQSIWYLTQDWMPQYSHSNIPYYSYFSSANMPQ